MLQFSKYNQYKFNSNVLPYLVIFETMTPTEASAVPSHNQSKILRLVGDFPEDIWGGRFNSYTMDQQMYNMYAKEIEILKEEVRRRLMATNCTIMEKLNLIDILERLGISYHFEVEIEQQLEKIFKLHANSEEYLQSYDLFTAALRFRLLRQHHFNVSCGIFDKFTDANGKFKEFLSSDIKGLLSLYEAAQLRTHADNILEEALAFTIVHLKCGALDLDASSSLAKQVKHALEQPLHKGSLRIEARHYISVYEEEESHDQLLLKFAKMDYNLLQMLHKEELAEIIRWGNELEIASKVPYSRRRLVESYFVALGMFFEPHHSLGRINLAKTIILTTIFDDTYDAYGTVDELEVFTDAIQRWDASQKDRLPDNMRTCYISLLNFSDRLHKELTTQGRPFGSDQYKEEWKIYTKGMYNESRWFIKRELPAFPEYLSNGLNTGLCYELITTCLLHMERATKDVFDWLSNRPKILVACAKICRLINDVGSHEIEKQRGGTGIECYMKHYNISEQEAMKKFEEMIEEAWKDLNEEWVLLRPTTTMSREVLMPILYLARIVEVLYKDREDGFTDPSKVIEHYVLGLLGDPLIV